MKYKIFVSGAQKELKKERRAVKEFIRKDALLSEYFDVFLFEDSPAKSKSAEVAYIEKCARPIFMSAFSDSNMAAPEKKDVAD